MRDVSLRTAVAHLLTGGKPDTSDVRSVEYVNDPTPGQPWSLRVVVNDGAGGDRTIRVDVVEE